MKKKCGITNKELHFISTIALYFYTTKLFLEKVNKYKIKIKGQTIRRTEIRHKLTNYLRFTLFNIFRNSLKCDSSCHKYVSVFKSTPCPLQLSKQTEKKKPIS